MKKIYSPRECTFLFCGEGPGMKKQNFDILCWERKEEVTIPLEIVLLDYFKTEFDQY